MTKTSSPLFYNGKVKLPAYPQDEFIFPVFHIREYIKPNELLCKHHYKQLILNYTSQSSKKRHIFTVDKTDNKRSWNQS